MREIALDGKAPGHVRTSSEPLGELLHLPNSLEEWSAALAQALDGATNASDRRRRQDVARQHDWEILVQKIAECLAERLGPQVSGEFRRRREFAVPIGASA